MRLQFLEHVNHACALANLDIWVVAIRVQALSAKVEAVGKAFERHKDNARLLKLECHTECFDELLLDHGVHQLDVASSGRVGDCPDDLLLDVWVVVEHQLD